ncbi:MAG: DUF4294 domain-containing protein, partial [Bacteroidetes bacterium]|nr:DUF4294 domain-containing protein [Bacteroidota bacterium]
SIVGNDTLGTVFMDVLVIRGDITDEQKSAYLANKRMMRDLKRVMPFAKELSVRIVEYDATLDSLEKRKDERKYINQEAKALMKEFEDDMRKLSLRQGKLLIKLIYRETGSSGYDLLSNYKGGGTAMFWNTFASIFGASLKQEYVAAEETEIEFLIEHLKLDK